MIELTTVERVIFVICAVLAIRFVYWLQPGELFACIAFTACFIAWQSNLFLKTVVVLTVMYFSLFSFEEKRSNSSSSSSSSSTISVTA